MFLGQCRVRPPSGGPCQFFMCLTRKANMALLPEGDRSFLEAL